jgi:hypothetical protein
MSRPIRITGARITPVAFADPPLLNTVGVHQPYALRAIIQLDTDSGLVGLGETYADTWPDCRRPLRSSPAWMCSPSTRSVPPSRSGCAVTTPPWAPRA